MLPARWRRVLRLRIDRHDVTRDVDQELEFHLQMRTQRLMAHGLDATAAKQRAQERFGNLPLIRNECLTIDHQQERAMRLADYLEGFRQDSAFAVRTLGRHRRFTAATLVVLAVGLGANIAMFALIDALMLRTLPVPHAEQLITVGDPTQTGSVSQGTADLEIASYPLYRDLRDLTRKHVDLLASGIAGSLDVLTDSSHGAEPQHPRGRLVSNNYFAVLGITAQLGRTFLRDSTEVAGSDPTVVISDGYWRRAFAADPAVVGRTLHINGAPFTIVGIGPRGFSGEIVGQAIDIWIPLAMQPMVMPHREWLGNRLVNWLMIMGRLTPGTSLDAARAEIVAVERRSIADHDSAGVGSTSAMNHPPVIQVGRGARGFSFYRRVQYTGPLYVLMAAVVLVLIIVCANVANLLVARGMTRSREIGIRMAIGAGRGRVVRQLLAESMLLAALGSLLGLVVAYWLGKLLLRFAGGRSAIPIDLQVDGHLVGFIALLVAATALLFGVLPAIHGTQVDVGTTLRGGGRGVAGQGRGSLRVGKALVIGQIALSLVLLIGVGMLERSMSHLEHADIGFNRDHLVIADIDAQRSGYDVDARAPLLRDLLIRLAQVPGVAGVTASSNGLYSGVEARTSFSVPGYVPQAKVDSTVLLDRVGPAYFQTIGARLVAGRDLRLSDDLNAPRVAIVNQSFARRYFPTGNPIGRRVSTGTTPGGNADREIVGVVADVIDHDIRDAPAPRLYVGLLQSDAPQGSFSMEIRAVHDPAALVAPVRRALLAANASLKIPSLKPVANLVDDSLSQDRMTTRMLTAFGLLALGLASVGLYGVMSYNTLRRTSEFGIRTALGATRANVVLLVLREAAWVLGAGGAIGLGVSLAATRVLRDQIFGIGLVDPVSIVIAIGALGSALLLATWLPARRAAGVGPLVALRSD